MGMKAGGYLINFLQVIGTIHGTLKVHAVHEAVNVSELMTEHVHTAAQVASARERRRCS